MGAALGLAGVGLGAVALVAAVRRWHQRNDLTTLQHAKLMWDQARAAGVAGTGAWKRVDQEPIHQVGRPVDPPRPAQPSPRAEPAS